MIKMYKAKPPLTKKEWRVMVYYMLKGIANPLARRAQVLSGKIELGRGDFQVGPFFSRLQEDTPNG